MNVARINGGRKLLTKSPSSFFNLIICHVKNKAALKEPEHKRLFLKIYYPFVTKYIASRLDSVMQLKDFEVIIREVQNPMFRLAIAFTGDEAKAKDIVQDAVIKLWKHSDKLDEVENVKAWSLRVTRNLCIDRKRKMKIIPSDLNAAYDVSTDQPDPERQSVVNDQISLVNKALDTLSDKQRTAMVLREMEGYSYQEVAEAMEENINQVKILIHRGRSKIKEFILKENQYGLIG